MTHKEKQTKRRDAKRLSKNSLYDSDDFESESDESPDHRQMPLSFEDAALQAYLNRLSQPDLHYMPSNPRMRKANKASSRP